MQSQMSPDFIEFKQGEYWRARTKVPDCSIPAGRVLMLKSIRMAEDKVHTLVLAGHPSEQINCKQEFRFLTDEFMKYFDPISLKEAEEVRKRELGVLQNHLLALQGKMTEASADPMLLTKAIAPAVRKWEVEQKVEPGFTDSLPVVDPDAIELMPTLTGHDISKMQLAISRRGEEARLVAAWFKDKSEEINATVQGMVPYMQEQADAAMARTEDIRAYVDKLSKGIASLDLYIGKDVDVLTIKEGASAPDDVKLSVQQSKLYVDEELAVFHDVGEGFSAHDLKQFREALVKHPGLVDQIFPSTRAIVCMATSRQHKDYSKLTAYRAAQEDAWNKQVFLLVRDGENIHEVISPIESHLEANHLFPSKDEIDSIFQDRHHDYDWETHKSSERVEEITYQDVEYTDRLRKHDNVALHYKRFMILLAGLDHRLNLFGHFHNYTQSMAFVSPKFQAEFIHFIHDDEYTALQLPGKTIESFKDYAQRHNNGLRSGSRVMCHWYEVITPHTAPSLTFYHRERDSGRGYGYHVTALEDCSVRVAFMEKGELCIKAPVKRDSFRSNREFEATLKLGKFRPNYYNYGLGYLVLDQVRADELESYIHNRVERRHFLNYLRVFKAAIEYLRIDEEKQKQSREAILEAIEAGGIATPAAAIEVTDQAICTWRAANRGADLPSKSMPQFRQLLDQVFELANKDGLLAGVERMCTRNNATPLRLTVDGKGGAYVYVAPTERDDRLFPHVWVKKMKVKRAVPEFQWTLADHVTLPEASPVETTIKEWPEAAEWVGKHSKITYAKKQALFNLVDSQSSLPVWMADTWTPEQFAEQKVLWKVFRDQQTEGSKMVINPDYALPIGLMHTTRPDRTVATTSLIVLTTDVSRRLWDKAPTETDRAAVGNEFIHWYKLSYRVRFLRELQSRDRSWKLCLFPVDADISNGMTSAPEENVSRVRIKDLADMVTPLDDLVLNARKSASGFYSSDPIPTVTYYIGEHACKHFFGGEQPVVTGEEPKPEATVIENGVEQATVVSEGEINFSIDPTHQG